MSRMSREDVASQLRDGDWLMDGEEIFDMPLLCLRPRVGEYASWPCGKCIPCRSRQRADWASRLMLERKSHDEACVVTLTYSDDQAPRNDRGEAVLDKPGFQKFMKRLRKQLAALGKQVRFYAVGEYGRKTYRPHFHVIFYGIGRQYEPLIIRAWQHGSVWMDDFSEKSVEYVSHYCLKKLGALDDFDTAPHGLPEEFHLGSRRPGIGAYYADQLGERFNTRSGDAALQKLGDVASQYRYKGRKRTIPAYMRTRMRKRCGIPVLARDRRSPVPKFRTMMDSERQRLKAKVAKVEREALRTKM